MRSPNIRAALICAFWLGAIPPLQADSPMPVVVIPIVKQEVPERVAAWGTLEKHPQNLHFEIDGYLTQIAVADDDRVAEGQLLARLDTTLVENRRDQASSALLYADQQLERTLELKHKGVVGQEQLDAVSSDERLKKLLLEGAEEELRKYFLYAPSAGRILRRLVDYAGPVSAATPLFVFKPDSAPWRATVEVAADNLSGIAVGDPVEASIEGFPGEGVVGRVERISGISGDRNGLFEVDVALPTVSGPLRAGMQVKVRFILARHPGYPVPLNAFFRLIGERGVLFVTGGGEQRVAHRLEVAVGLIQDNVAVVTTDLSGFDAVITQGQDHLRDGMAIEVRGDRVSSEAR